MHTRMLSTSAENIAVAAQILKDGGLVAFPTETVYGLGASALNAGAVGDIFVTKGRPSDNPLIVHVADKDISALAELNEIANKLIDEFWPGPLTIILKKKDVIPDIVTAGLDNVAIRMPSNKIALALISGAGPLAAPSANLASKPSPTNANHVLSDLQGKIPFVIDGGDCDVGIESTVVDLTSKPVILRPGGVSKEQLEKVIGEVDVVENSDRPSSPGMKYTHYSPDAELILVEGEASKVRNEINKLISENSSKKIVVLSTSDSSYNVETIILGKSSDEVAHNLFNSLRNVDCDLILVEGISEEGIGLGVMNRLRKAANKILSC